MMGNPMAVAVLLMLSASQLPLNNVSAHAVTHYDNEAEPLLAPMADGGMVSNHHKDPSQVRQRRQVSVPSNSPWQQQPQSDAVPPPPPQREENSALSFLSNLGPQLERAKALASLFSSDSDKQRPPQAQALRGPDYQQAPGYQQQPAAANNGGGFGQQMISALQATQLMSQLAEMIRSSQDTTARTAAETQRSLSNTQYQGANAAVQAQGGIQSALSEIGTGLQRLATNNPNLLPDIKNLYQSVSSKLTSASNNVAQAATDGTTNIVPQLTPSPGQQLADALLG